MVKRKKVMNGKCKNCKVIYSWRVRNVFGKVLLLRDAHCPECSEKLVRCSKSDYDNFELVVRRPRHHDFVVERIGV
jgi:hypothetical protein